LCLGGFSSSKMIKPVLMITALKELQNFFSTQVWLALFE
jgi:hypothetical protein